MVSLARERAGEAAVVLGHAESLPFQAQDFTAVSMSIVLIFFPDPLTRISAQPVRGKPVGGQVRR